MKMVILVTFMCVRLYLAHITYLFRFTHFKCSVTISGYQLLGHCRPNSSNIGRLNLFFPHVLSQTLVFAVSIAPPLCKTILKILSIVV